MLQKHKKSQKTYLVPLFDMLFIFFLNTVFLYNLLSQAVLLYLKYIMFY